ncbi:hypothetical protein D0Z00_000229 [Geotrichum galactomycetum]|uniref:Uncharacterized protein n=1 Tax=Geotrichum galactomycetum TaxID=27317 RepID=A0ACB6VAI6_9ASCO|nr:hypothetical protein D0Z00_000229 [Geotrichum candidum]
MLRQAFLRQPARQVFARSFSSTASRADVAKLTLVGRVGSDINELEASSGRKYAKYSLAVNTSKNHTSWFNITVFDENAINYLKTYVNKGNTIYVEANASIQQYESAEGKKLSSINLVQRKYILYFVCGAIAFNDQFTNCARFFL